MALSPLRKVTNATGTLVGLPIALLQYSISEPFITGPLLYILTRGPPHVRERLLGLLRTNLLAKNATSRLEKAISVLKALFALGVLQRVNRALNQLAMNFWYLPGTKPMAKWNWDGKTEVVVITGGCSGFGYEMVKGFAGKAKIVVLDVLDLPQELEKCKSDPPRLSILDPRCLKRRLSNTMNQLRGADKMETQCRKYITIVAT